MGNISCIILNYNDSETTVGLVQRLEEYDCISNLIVVDNHSPEDDWRNLKDSLEGKRLHLLRTEENGGYGWGNQSGIDYAMEHGSPDYIMIANPDILVTEAAILRVRDALAGQPDGAAASAMVRSPDGRELFSYWELVPRWKELLDAGLITRRLFRRLITTPPGKLPQAVDGGSRIVGAVPGSFFLIKMSCFTGEQAKGLFDPSLFLYCEEKVLGQKLRAMGLKEVLVMDAFYVHAHSVSIDKSAGSITAKQRLLHGSRLYYYRRYLHAGPFAMVCARVWLAAVLWEVRFLTEVLGMRW